MNCFPFIQFIEFYSYLIRQFCCYINGFLLIVVDKNFIHFFLYQMNRLDLKLNLIDHHHHYHQNRDHHHHHGLLSSNSTTPVGLLIRSCSDLLQSILINSNNNDESNDEENKIKMDQSSSVIEHTNSMKFFCKSVPSLQTKKTKNNIITFKKQRSFSSSSVLLSSPLSPSLLMNNIETAVKDNCHIMNKRFIRSSSCNNWPAKLLQPMHINNNNNKKVKTLPNRCMALAYGNKKYRSSSSILTIVMLITVIVSIWSSTNKTNMSTVCAASAGIEVGNGNENESPGGGHINIVDDEENRSLHEWDDIFHSRSADDWRQLWHRERHRRCRHDLLAHMELVCQKDIYKLNRRRKKRTNVNDDFYQHGIYIIRNSFMRIKLYLNFFCY